MFLTAPKTCRSGFRHVYTTLVAFAGSFAFSPAFLDGKWRRSADKTLVGFAGFLPSLPPSLMAKWRRSADKTNVVGVFKNSSEFLNTPFLCSCLSLLLSFSLSPPFAPFLLLLLPSGTRLIPDHTEKSKLLRNFYLPPPLTKPAECGILSKSYK